MGTRTSFSPVADNPLRSRTDVLRALEALTRPLPPCASVSGARISTAVGGAVFDQVAAELEGYARPLWGIAAAAHAGDHLPHLDRWREGLVAGTNPANPDFWGWPKPVDQRQVECAAIGYALALAPAAFCAPISVEARRRVADYLRAARQLPVSDNNWHCFHAMMDAGLAALGEAPGLADSEAALARTDRFRLGNGWYRDGDTEQVDHYNGFAFHFYALVHLALGRATPARADAVRRDATTFARSYADLFATNGAALPLGRSLTYRFAPAAFWGALALADVEALPWGVIKGLYLRHLRWWATRPIATRGGILTVGHAYPNQFVAEDYTSPMSPYWVFKAFVPLALAADHPFWTSSEAVPDSERPDRSITEPGLLIRHFPDRTIALASGQSNPRVRGGPEKYAKFSYSTASGISLEVERSDRGRLVAENMLALVDGDGVVRVRSRVEEARIGADLLWSRWRPMRDTVVDTWLWWHAYWQMRVHRVVAGSDLEAIEGGSAIAGDSDDLSIRVGSRDACVIAGGMVCRIADCGAEMVRPEVHAAEPNTNILAPRTYVPRLVRRVAPGVQWLLTATTEHGDDVARGEVPMVSRDRIDALAHASADLTAVTALLPKTA